MPSGLRDISCMHTPLSAWNALTSRFRVCRSGRGMPPRLGVTVCWLSGRMRPQFADRIRMLSERVRCESTDLSVPSNSSPARKVIKETMSLKVALMRSVVINGQRVKMADARALVESVGGTAVQSVIATGNLVFRSDEGTSVLEKMLE